MIIILSLIFFYSFFYLYSLNNNINISLYNIFFIYHTLFISLFIFLNFSNLLPTDTFSQYMTSIDNFNFKINDFSTDNLILGINYIFINYFRLGFDEINYISIIIKIFSTLLILKIITNINDKKIKLYLIILLLLPSYNYFTIGLNKDSLSNLFLVIVLYSILIKNFYLTTFCVFLIFLIRPYVCFIFLSSFLFFFSIRFFLYKIKNIKEYAAFFLLAIPILFIISFILKNYTGSFGHYFLDGDFMRIIVSLQSHYTDTPMGISTDIPVLLRIFNYIFYPIFYIEDFRFIFFIMIFENFFLLFLFIRIIFFSKNKFNFKAEHLFLLVFFGSILIILSLVTSNYGIAFRQKWMCVPFLLLLLAICRQSSVKFNSKLSNK